MSGSSKAFLFCFLLTMQTLCSEAMHRAQADRLMTGNQQRSPFDQEIPQTPSSAFYGRQMPQNPQRSQFDQERPQYDRLMTGNQQRSPFDQEIPQTPSNWEFDPQMPQYGRQMSENPGQQYPQSMPQNLQSSRFDQEVPQNMQYQMRQNPSQFGRRPLFPQELARYQLENENLFAGDDQYLYDSEEEQPRRELVRENRAATPSDYFAENRPQAQLTPSSVPQAQMTPQIVPQATQRVPPAELTPAVPENGDILPGQSVGPAQTVLRIGAVFLNTLENFEPKNFEPLTNYVGTMQPEKREKVYTLLEAAKFLLTDSLRGVLDTVSTEPTTRPVVSNAAAGVADNIASIPNSFAGVADNIASIPNSVAGAADNIASVPNSVAGAADNIASVPKSVVGLADNIASVSDQAFADNTGSVPNSAADLADNVARLSDTVGTVPSSAGVSVNSVIQEFPNTVKETINYGSNVQENTGANQVTLNKGLGTQQDAPTINPGNGQAFRAGLASTPDSSFSSKDDSNVMFDMADDLENLANEVLTKNRMGPTSSQNAPIAETMPIAPTMPVAPVPQSRLRLRPSAPAKKGAGQPQKTRSFQ